jgi:hypothetical protein
VAAPAVAVAVLALGFWAAYVVRWYCDDIFITLRYAQQFLAGNGFVYNVGERVEGYTHFLWLVIITLLERVGLDPVRVSVYGGLVSYLATIGMLLAVSWRMAPHRASFVFPFAALALVANYECNIWATSGMETFFFAFLLALAFWLYFFATGRERVRVTATSLCLVLAGMTRPDGLLIYAVAGVLLALRAVRALVRKRDASRAGRAVRDVALFAAPLVVVYAPYVAWKVSFYGSFFPNTYYAKSAYLSYYSEGFYFVWLYFLGHPTSALFVLCIPPLVVAWRRRTADRSDTAALAAFVAVVVYLVAFVARVGGGFMYPRFVIPMLPFVYFLIEWSARRLLPRRSLRVAVLLIVVLGIATGETMLRNHVLFDTTGGELAFRDRRGIIDEHRYYTRVYPLKKDRLEGELLRPYFEGLDATVVLRGQACFGYFAGFKTSIENSGLTDSTIAHRQLEERGRIGHEKSPTYEYLLRRGANFTFSRRPYKDRGYRIVNFLFFGDVRVSADMITYDANLMDQLRQRMGRDISFVHFDDYLDRYIAEEIDHKSHDELAADYAEFKEFYFDRNPDPVRERAFLDRLAGR